MLLELLAVLLQQLHLLVGNAESESADALQPGQLLKLSQQWQA